MQTHDTTTATDRPIDGPPSPWLTVDAGAAYIGVRAQYLYREIAAGRLRAARLGNRRSLRLRREWLDAYLDACATCPVSSERGR